MKSNFFPIALLLFSNQLFSQDFAGKRIINASLNLDISSDNTNYNNNALPSSQDYSQNRSNITLSFLQGKIKADNKYTAYGLNFSLSSQNNTGQYKTTTSGYSLGPRLQFGKFIKVFDQFYFAPSTSFSTSFGKSENNGLKSSIYSVNASIAPLSFVYKLNDKLLFNISLGQFGMNYLNQKFKNNDYKTNRNEFNIVGNISNQVGISAFYLFK
jgi:hypothetical protein